MASLAILQQQAASAHHVAEIAVSDSPDNRGQQTAWQQQTVSLLQQLGTHRNMSRRHAECVHPVCRLLVSDESTHTCTSRCMEQSDGVQGLPYSAFADSPSLHQEMPLSSTHADVSLCRGP